MLRLLRWQILLALAGVLGVGLLLIAFSNRAFEDRPSPGGDLVEAVVGRPAVLNPLFAVEGPETDVVRLVFSGLARPGANGRLEPGLAESWSVEPDGLTYTFKLRSDAVWHDGEPVTADDVVFTADAARRIANDDRLSVAASHLVGPWAGATARAVDDTTVEVVLDAPYAPFLDAATLGILPSHLFADVPLDAMPHHRYSRLEPVGSGAYRVDQPGGVGEGSVRLTRFDEHWSSSEGRPMLDTITLRFFGAVDEAVAALGEGEVQAMGNVPTSAIETLGDDARVYLAQQPGYSLVYLNNDNVLFSDPSVRQALSFAVDRTGIVQDTDLLAGQGVPASGPISAGWWVADPRAEAPAYDPDLARALLDELGWIDGDGDGVRDREGKSLRFKLGTRDDPQSLLVAERVRDDWGSIGVEAEIEPMNQPATVTALSDRAFDSLLFSWDLRQYDPDPYPLWHSSQIDAGQNYGGFANEDADRLLAAGRRAHPEDDDARSVAYREFQQLFSETQPALVLYHPVYAYVVVDPGLGGVQLPELVVRPDDRFLTLPSWFMQTERVFLNRSGDGNTDANGEPPASDSGRE